MVAWNGIGMNYGHQASYDSSVVESDLTYLASLGFTRLRLAMPTYGFTIAGSNSADLVTRALNHGFYATFGMTTGTGIGALTATTWSAFKTYLTGTLVPYAISIGLPELLIGNEADFEADGSTLTKATVRSDVRGLVATIKNAGYTGVVSYSTSVLELSNWVSEGIGSLDKIGFNSYDTLSNFTSRNTTIISTFGSKGYISEFGCITKGYSDYGNESDWYSDVVNRVTNLKSSGMSAGYFFCYRDGSFGLSQNSFALQLSPSGTRTALYAVQNVTTQAFNRFNVRS